MKVQCKRCQVSLPLPQLTDAERSRVATRVREGKHSQAVRLLRDLTRFDLHDCKAIEIHITRTPGICIRCGRSLSVPGKTECPKCGSLNLDW